MPIDITSTEAKQIAALKTVMNKSWFFEFQKGEDFESWIQGIDKNYYSSERWYEHREQRVHKGFARLVREYNKELNK